MIIRICIFFLLFSQFVFSQISEANAPVRINEQTRYNSESRVFYKWNEATQVYDAKDSEFENSIIDVREIDSKKNGYVVISLTDDGKVRSFHGSIISYSQDEEGNPTWILRSKNARGKVVLNPKKMTVTYSYESNGDRYLKIFVFYLTLKDIE